MERLPFKNTSMHFEIVSLTSRLKFCKSFITCEVTAPATELAKALNPQKPHVLVASGAVRRIGRAFSDYLNFVPGMYEDNKPAYYELVGRGPIRDGQCIRIFERQWQIWNS